MDHRTVPNYNQIQIQFLQDYVEGVIEEIEEGTLIQEIEQLRNSVVMFESQLAEFSHLEKGEQIIDLENLRNELLEVILDRLDDHLNVTVLDEDNDLEAIGLDSETVLNGLSGFSEAHRLLGTNSEGDPDFHSRYDRSGHLWEEHRYREFLNRLESGEYEEETEFLGIAERSLEVLALDHRQCALMEELQCGEILKELRKLRYIVRSDLEPLYHVIYTSGLLVKKKHGIPAIELLIDDINAQNEEREMVRSSLNDLTYDQFISDIENVLEGDVPGDSYDEWNSLKENELFLMKKSVEFFHKEECWNEFEQSEMILLRSVERFFWELPSNTNSAEADGYEVLHEKFRKSPRYLMAIEIIEELQEKGIHVDRLYSRGDTVYSNDISMLIELSEEEEMKSKLDLLRLCPLLEEICESNIHSRELIEPVIRKYNTISLDELRELRTRLTAFFRAIIS